MTGQRVGRGRFHGRGHQGVLPLVDGEFRSCLQTAATAFSRPVGKPGHAPPPPRPFGQVGDIVAVNVDRCRSGF